MGQALIHHLSFRLFGDVDLDLVAHEVIGNGVVIVAAFFASVDFDRSFVEIETEVAESKMDRLLPDWPGSFLFGSLLHVPSFRKMAPTIELYRFQYSGSKFVVGCRLSGRLVFVHEL